MVPFSPETLLSGVGQTVRPNELLWYKRKKLNYLNGLTSDYSAFLAGRSASVCVNINGKLVGMHTGGYLFSFDVTVLQQAEAGGKEILTGNALRLGSKAIPALNCAVSSGFLVATFGTAQKWYLAKRLVRGRFCSSS